MSNRPPMRERKVPKEAATVRMVGKKGSSQNQLRGELYAVVHAKLKQALENQYYFEAITLCDMVITDRMEAHNQYLRY